MNNQRYSLEKIEETISNWADNTALIKEGEGTRFLHFLNDEKNSDQGYVNQLKARLYSLLAFARCLRIQRLDDFCLEWLDEAMTIGSNEAVVNEMYIKIYERHLLEPLFSKEFPQIRETDHGNTKKQVASTYLSIANDFFEKIPIFENVLLNLLRASQTIYDDEKIIRFQALVDTLYQLKDPVRRVVKATAAYADSLKGIYYSQQQSKEISIALKEIKHLKQKWNHHLFIEDESIQRKQETLVELEKMVGLTDIKQRVEQLYHYLNYQKLRKEKGYRLKEEISLNMILTGNPGTGKTTLARLLAKIYFELGILPREEVIEVDRSHLVGSFVGQTEENTMNMIKHAVGGVLFIDEAYSLKRDGVSNNDYGQTVIDTLVSAMTSGAYAGKFAVILAGYPEEMRQFLWSNPGLRSRFPESNHIHLQDYTTDELIEIAEVVALDNDYSFSPDAIYELRKRIEREQVDTSFGNARTVKNIVQNAIFQKGAKVGLHQKIRDIDFTTIFAEDIEVKERIQVTESGIEQLETFVGQVRIKNEVKKLMAFVKVQQARQEKGLPTVPIQLHSIFSGDPGTGKTTVAMIYATILKELGLLKRGHLVVVGRADLVSGYIGQTALKTKKKIREALGGVLFIDEAYSLLRGGQADFGREVIDTLVDEMTKHNENLVVILAGYPNEMKQLIASNPGLQSRFKQYFHFEHYTVTEMVEIISFHAKKMGYSLSQDAIALLHDQLIHEQNRNGRYAVDLVNKAIVNHSVRVATDLLSEDIDQLSLLKEKDFI